MNYTDGDPREAGMYFMQLYCPSPPLGGPFDEASRKHIWLDGFAGSCVAGIPATQGRFGLYLAMDIFPPEHENVRRMLSYLNRGGVTRAVYWQCVNRRFPTFEQLRKTISGTPGGWACTTYESSRARRSVRRARRRLGSTTSRIEGRFLRCSR